MISKSFAFFETNSDQNNLAMFVCSRQCAVVFIFIYDTHLKCSHSLETIILLGRQLNAVYIAHGCCHAHILCVCFPCDEVTDQESVSGAWMRS